MHAQLGLIWSIFFSSQSTCCVWKTSISEVESRINITLHDYLLKFQPLTWQLPLVRFQSIPAEEFTRPPRLQVCHKDLDSLRSMSCDFIGCLMETSTPVPCVDPVVRVRGAQRSGCEKNMRGKNSRCITATSVEVLWSFLLLHLMPEKLTKIIRGISSQIYPTHLNASVLWFNMVWSWARLS